jgi:hypothetical protein
MMMIMEEEAEGEMTIAVSMESDDSDFSKDDVDTNATSVDKGEEAIMGMDFEDTPATSKDENTNNEMMMEVDDHSGMLDAATTTTIVDVEDKDTGDVLDLEKLHELLAQSKNAGDLIAGKNVMLLIGGTGAGKVSFFFHFLVLFHVVV